MSGSPEAIGADAPAVGSRPWPRWQRLAFRYLLCHWLFYSFPLPLSVLLGDLARGISALGGWLGFDAASRPWRWPGKWSLELGKIDGAWQEVTSWLSARGLTPYEVIHQPTGSGDTGHEFARLLVVVAAALVGTALWSLLDRSQGYPRLGRWLHLLVRWGLAFQLLGYGLAKLYGSQFGELGPLRLTTEVGDLKPMTMVGTFLQANRAYEVFGGVGETLAALLLFHRRTAALGAVLAVAVLTNVCALNWLCGVPVKLYSSHLLAMAALLLAPYAGRLWAVFVRNAPSQPVDLAVVRSRWLGWPLAALGWLFAVGHLVLAHQDHSAEKPWLRDWARSPLQGVWVVESMTADGVEVPATDPGRWRHLAIDRGTLAWIRDPYGNRQFLEFRLAPDRASAAVRPAGASAASGDADVWQLVVGSRKVPVARVDVQRAEDRGRTVDAERRTLEVRGPWRGQKLEVRLVEHVYALKTPFRLRQELPDGW